MELEPVFDSVPVPKSVAVPEKLPALTPSVAALLSDTVPPETLPCRMAVAPLSSNEPLLIEANVAAEVAEARPPLSVPITSVAALADPPLRIVSCKKPPLAETVPALTPAPLIMPLVNCVTPDPERLPNVTVPVDVNVALPELATVPNEPLPEIVALPVVLMVNGALKLTAFSTAPETVMLLVDARAPVPAVKVPAVTDVAPAYVLAPESVKLPEPAFTREPLPLKVPADVVLESLTSVNATAEPEALLKLKSPAKLFNVAAVTALPNVNEPPVT